MTTMALPEQEVIYPDSDGQPMADNTKQFRWIITIEGGIDALFADRPDVFVAGDLLWYPVKGNNKIRLAPDAMVVFGRPKGDRGSYQQWREEGIAPQVVFEVLSPGNSLREMIEKLRFYERYGVEEFYVYDPDRGTLDGWLRVGQELAPIDSMAGWTSPRLGIRFEMDGCELEIYRPDGRKFATYIELDQRAEQAEQAAAQAQERAERLAAQLRALGVDPELLP